MIATRLAVCARRGFGALVLFAVLVVTPTCPAETSAVEFRQNDRVVLLGGTFIERLQVYGHLETRLTAALGDRNVTFRNLGWSGDTVWGEARAVFGTPADGFKRLVKDTLDAKPTLLLTQYGANEAQSGSAGIAEFIAQYGRLLDALAPSNARVVLLSPVRRERVSASLPDPAPYNSQLDAYCEAIADFARSRKVAYVDLRDLFDNPPQLTSATETRTAYFTDNGLHPNEPGSLLAADRLAAKLKVPTIRWSVAVNANGASAPLGLSIESFSRDQTSVRFEATAAYLPAPPVYRNRQPGGQGAASQPPAPIRLPDLLATLRVMDLETGDYDLFIDGTKVATADASAWAAGLGVEIAADTQQAETLRQTIYDKNVLYFHRYRPQNETYLFLFRKHEQGNNAIEIPQFDPLIAAKEAEIAKLRVPTRRKFEIKKAAK